MKILNFYTLNKILPITYFFLRFDSTKYLRARFRNIFCCCINILRSSSKFFSRWTFISLMINKVKEMVYVFSGWASMLYDKYNFSLILMTSWFFVELLVCVHISVSIWPANFLCKKNSDLLWELKIDLAFPEGEECGVTFRHHELR